jgi:exosortase
MTDTSVTPPAPNRRRPLLVALAFCLAVTLIAHATTVLETTGIWSSARSYTFAWAVPPTLLYLLWHNRDRFRAIAPRPSLWGIVAAGICALLWLAADLANIGLGRQLATVAAIAAVTLAAVGWPLFRALIPHLALLAFLVPAGDFLFAPLKYVAIAIIRAYTAFADIPFRADGFAVFIADERYVVIDYCAALPYVLTYLFLGLTLGLLIYRKPWKIAALALFAAGLAIAANGARIIAIVTHDYLTGVKMEVGEHGLYEWPTILLSLAILFLVFARLTPDQNPPAAAKPVPSRPTRPGTTFECAAAALVATMIVAAAPYLISDSAPAADIAPGERADLLPTALAIGWTRTDAAPSWRPTATGGATIRTGLATYTRDGQSITAFVAEAASRRDKVSGGTIKQHADDQEWLAKSTTRRIVCPGPDTDTDTGANTGTNTGAEAPCHPIEHSIHVRHQSTDVRHVYATYAQGTETTNAPLTFRLARARAALAGNPPPARYLALAYEAPEGLAETDIATLIEALVNR